MNKEQVIGSSLLFEGLTPQQLESISAIARVKKFKRGETIFFEGEEGVGFFMVGEGKVKSYKVSPSGKEQILHIFGEGEPFGEVPVFSGRPFPASAADEARVAVFSFSKTSALVGAVAACTPCVSRC